MVAITQRKNSTLANMSDVVIVLKGKNKYENHELSKLAPLGTLFELTDIFGWTRR